MRGVISLPSLLLLAATLALAQGIDGTLTGQAPRAGLTLFDEIQSAPERAAFREVWDTKEPIREKELGLRFVDRFPGSIVLREAYELIARACIATGDEASGLDWAQRSLRHRNCALVRPKWSSRRRSVCRWTATIPRG